VDICTPPQFDGNAWSYIDLELDLFCNSSGAVGVVDVDEFDLLVGRGVLSEEVVLAARSSAKEVQEALTWRREPFGQAGWDHLARAEAADL
jgi:predicted RNA-binding protein associated with RNAse of E/G family